MDLKIGSVLRTQLQHVTIRSFLDKPISDELLQTILEAGRRAPTSSNMQAYSILVIRNPETKQQLSILAGNQKHVESCPVFLAFCADLHRLEVACAKHDVEMTNNLETFQIATIDASLVGMSVQTGVESAGLGAVMIGAMRNDPQAVAELLGLPPKVYVVFGMCVGWPNVADIPAQKPRLSEPLVIHPEKYNDEIQGEGIDLYDQELSAYYESLKRNLHPAAWSGVIARNLSKPLRPQLKHALTQMGFNVDLS